MLLTAKFVIRLYRRNPIKIEHELLYVYISIHTRIYAHIYTHKHTHICLVIQCLKQCSEILR